MKEIPYFTKEDFLKTEKPYKFIEENAANQLEREQLIELIRENSLQVGVKNFVSLQKAYCHDNN